MFRKQTVSLGVWDSSLNRRPRPASVALVQNTITSPILNRYKKVYAPNTKVKYLSLVRTVELLCLRWLKS